MRTVGRAIDRLRRANPVRAEDMPSPDSASARAVLERIIQTPAQPAPPAGGSRRRLLLVAIPIALTLAAGVAVTMFRRADRPLVVCFSAPDLESDRVVTARGGGDPTSTCTPFWTPGGEFARQGRPAAPRLIACVLDTGSVGVFPAEAGIDSCQALGLSMVASDPATPQVLRLEEELSRQFLSRCISETEGTSIVRDELASSSLRGWRVQTSGSFSTGSCASVAVDAVNRIVYLVPIPSPP